MLKQDLGSRIVEEGPAEHCPAPVALQICHQSRMHTLGRYRVMTSLAGPFYYHTQRDVMFFSVDVADDYPIHKTPLLRSQKAELDILETVPVLDSEWPESPVEKGDRRMITRWIVSLILVASKQSKYYGENPSLVERKMALKLLPTVS